MNQLGVNGFSLKAMADMLLINMLIKRLGVAMSNPVGTMFFLLFLFTMNCGMKPRFFHKLGGSNLPRIKFTMLVYVIDLMST